MTSRRDGASHADAELWQFAELTIDFAGRTLWAADEREISLTRGEFMLLYALVRSGGRVLSRDQLLDVVAARRAEPFDRSIDVMVGRLRRKIEPDPKRPRLIVTVAGFGYRLAVPVDLVAARARLASVSPTKSTEITHVAPERRHITTLATELLAWEGGSLPADPEALRDLIGNFRRCVAGIVIHYGGVVRETRGRHLLAFFGYPQAQEHIAERAIHAALVLVGSQSPGLPAGGLLSRTESEAAPNDFTVRVGVASGLIIAESTGEVLGEAPAEAERLLSLAEPGQVIIGAGTRRLVGNLFAYYNLGRVTMKGIAEPLQALQVLGPTTLASRSEALHSDTMRPLVGREEELSLLLRAWEQTKMGSGRLVLLSGEPGIGKSRLLAALVEGIAAEPHTSLGYFCSPLHQDSVLYPIIARLMQECGFDHADSSGDRLCKLEAVLARSELPPEDVALIAALLSIPTNGRYPQPEFSPQRHRERIFGALLRRLVNLARKEPVLMLCEDTQWADPSSLELLDALLGRLGQLPILLVISYRTEFAAPWIGRPGASLILLNRLTRQQSAALATQVAAERVLAPPGTLERIVTQTDGVPLFIEELTKTVLETSADVEGPAPPLTVPTTLQASLMARLDRLPAAKQVAQIGGVIGREFPHRVLAAVAPLSEAQHAQGLNELVASGLATRRGISEDAVYTFKHALVQDAAYQSLLRGRRAEIHAAIVAASERDASLAIEPGVLGHHCAEAGLIAKAADNYRLAGQQAAERAALVETKTQLERGLGFASTLPDGPDRHCLEAELLLALVDVLQITKGYASDEAGVVSTRAIQLCRRLNDQKLLFRALAARISFLSTRGEMAAAHSLAQEALELEASKETFLNAIAHTGIGDTLLWQGRFAEARKHLAAAVALTERSAKGARLGSRSDVYGHVNLALTLACLGYPHQAGGQAQRAIDWASRRGSFALAYALSNVGAVLFILRDDVGLRERNTAQIALCEEHGYLQVLASGRCVLGWLEAKQGRVDQGLRLLCGGLTSMHDLGVVFALPLHYGLKADALALGGRRAEAIAALDTASEILHRTGDAWWAAELYRRRGELLLTGSEPNASEQALLQAIRVARDQSAKFFELRAAMSLSRLWTVQGKRNEARDLLGPIYHWFTEGFDAPDLKDAKALLDELA